MAKPKHERENEPELLSAPTADLAPEEIGEMVNLLDRWRADQRVMRNIRTLGMQIAEWNTQRRQAQSDLEIVRSQAQEIAERLIKDKAEVDRLAGQIERATVAIENLGVQESDARVSSDAARIALEKLVGQQIKVRGELDALTEQKIAVEFSLDTAREALASVRREHDEIQAEVRALAERAARV